MPSPFPGMDPFLEHPANWPDFHNRFADGISVVLNRVMPRTYYAQMEHREQVGVFSDGLVRRIIPDVSISRSEGPFGNKESHSGTAVLDGLRTDVSESVLFEVQLDRQRIPFVEVRDASRGHEVITIIEIISPSNKQAGEDRDDYVRKRNEILDSSTSLVEIDLLRTGTRLWAGLPLERRFQAFTPPPDYVAIVNRSWDRPRQMKFQIFRSSLQSPLPVISIPLRQGEAEIPLDLQFVFNRAYDDGPYSRSVDYSQLQSSGLPEALLPWARERIGIAG